jgi:uncharacterized protein
MQRRHIVVDTNVIISAILFGGKPRKILDFIISGSIDCSLSISILDELTHVLQRPKFGFSPAACFEIVEQLSGLCNIVDPSIRVNAVKNDPSDNRILECALEAKAEFIVTGDPHLLTIETFEGIRILNPSEFLNLR